jgi:hypothetical protein
MAVHGPQTLIEGKGTWYAVDGVSILIVPAREVDDREWVRLLKESKNHSKTAGIITPSSVSFYGWSVSAAQRKAAAEFADPTLNARHVVLTHSSLTRGAIRALTWLMPSLNVRAFAPHEWSAGSDWIAEVTPHDRKALGECIRAAFAAHSLPTQGPP